MPLTDFERAEVLVQALPYIKRYNGKIVVIKYGGNAMIDEEMKSSVMQDIVLLWLIGVKVVLVHGGGPEMNRLMSKLDKHTEFVEGLRVTDRETVEIAEMVLAGKVNKTLVNLLEVKGGSAIGISGIDGHLIEATFKDKKLGFVGKIVKVHPKPLLDLLENGYIPVVSTLGCDRSGNNYNINGDTAAAWIAGALNAEKLILMTDVAGILRDPKDADSLIDKISISEAEDLRRGGIITGGMIPKVECCWEAIRKGVKNVVVLDGRVKHSILTELLTDKGSGTLIEG